MFQIVIGVLGVIVAIVYVGYLAYSIGSIPLWVIVIATIVLMLRETIIDFRDEARRSTRTAK